MSLLVHNAILSIAYPMPTTTKMPSKTCDGTWYLSPTYHATEGMALVALGFCLLDMANTFNPTPDSNLNLTLSWSEHATKYIMAFDFCFHVYVKTHRLPKGRGIWWVLNPCSIMHVVLLLLMHWPHWVSVRTLHVLVTLTAGSFCAMRFPDIAGSTTLIHIHFWMQHLFIYMLPHIWLFKHARLMQSTLSIWNVVSAHALIKLYHFSFLQWAAIVSGVNLNYLLSPPPITLVSQFGRYFRIATCVFMWLLHIITGYIVPVCLLSLYTNLQSIY